MLMTVLNWGGKTQEWRPSHHCPLASPFLLIFPWRSIKRQPFERVLWFLGISGDKMHLCICSFFNYSIWGSLIWQHHAGTVNRAATAIQRCRTWHCKSNQYRSVCSPKMTQHTVHCLHNPAQNDGKTNSDSMKDTGSFSPSGESIW